jgi:hypothetical protein
MHTLAQNLDLECAAGEAAQRSRAPELFVVRAARVERDHQPGSSDPLRQMLDIVRQVEAAALFARFDHDHASRVRDTLRLQRADRRQTSEQRIAVVGGAASIQAIAFDHRLPRIEARAPSRHLRLLVEMAIQQNRLAHVARNFNKYERRALRQPDHFQREPLDRLAARPFLEACNHAIHLAVRRPIGIESHRFVGNADIFAQLRDDRFVPEPVYIIRDCGLVHDCQAYATPLDECTGPQLRNCEIRMKNGEKGPHRAVRLASLSAR